MLHSQEQSDEQDLLTREIEEIVGRKLEPLLGELTRLREYLNALGAVLEPW